MALKENSYMNSYMNSYKGDFNLDLLVETTDNKKMDKYVLVSLVDLVNKGTYTCC